jgi:hypothetical protein
MVLRVADNGRMTSLSFEAAQQRIAVERIGLKLIAVVHMPNQVLFGCAETGRYLAAGCFFGLTAARVFMLKSFSILVPSTSREYGTGLLPRCFFMAAVRRADLPHGLINLGLRYANFFRPAPEFVVLMNVDPVAILRTPFALIV